jgi:GON domain
MSMKRFLTSVLAVLGITRVAAADPAAAQPIPASCLAIRTADPTAPDGNYTISINSRILPVYCANMASAPAEYLNLVNTGGDFNFGQYTAGGATPGTSVRTSYTRVRLDPAALLVNIADQTFATSTGSLSGPGGALVTSMPYGVAFACIDAFDDAGLANIDLTGTPLAVVNTFSVQGFLPAGTTTVSDNNQVVNLTGGGFCGWNAPASLFNPINTNAGFNLQLTFISYAGTPGAANCHGKSVAGLAAQYGDLAAAAQALGFPSVQLLQRDIDGFCQS